MANVDKLVADAAVMRDMGYLSEAEICGLLGISIKTFRNRQASGDAPPECKVGKRKLYKRADVDRWIARRRVTRAHV